MDRDHFQPIATQIQILKFLKLNADVILQLHDLIVGEVQPF